MFLLVGVRWVYITLSLDSQIYWKQNVCCKVFATNFVGGMPEQKHNEFDSDSDEFECDRI